MAKQTLYPFVALHGISDDGKISGIHSNGNDVCDWMEKFNGWDQIERFIAINENRGIVFAYKWGDGWYSSDCLNDCNDFEQVRFREMMAELGFTAEYSNDPNWVRWVVSADGVQKVKMFLQS